jgi:hypothetical protein
MLAAVQKLYAFNEKMHPRYPLFLPLVVDITDPAKANYSLPGLFPFRTPSVAAFPISDDAPGVCIEPGNILQQVT